MPPEQARGEPVDERADVYALGAMLYHVLAGTAPQPSGDRDALAVRSPTLEPRLPPDLLAIVDKAMARDRGAATRPRASSPTISSASRRPARRRAPLLAAGPRRPLRCAPPPSRSRSRPRSCWQRWRPSLSPDARAAKKRPVRNVCTADPSRFRAGRQPPDRADPPVRRPPCTRGARRVARLREGRRPYRRRATAARPARRARAGSGRRPPARRGPPDDRHRRHDHNRGRRGQRRRLHAVGDLHAGRRPVLRQDRQRLQGRLARVRRLRRRRRLHAAASASAARAASAITCASGGAAKYCGTIGDGCGDEARLRRLRDGRRSARRASA